MAHETNEKFAAKVGVHFTMASKIRNGQRLPSGRLLSRIVAVYDLDADEAMTAYIRGPLFFGDYIERHVFDGEHAA